jgi:hypothetical protein
MERAFSPFLFRWFHIPGLCPGLVWIAPSALKLLSWARLKSAEGAFYISLESVESVDTHYSIDELMKSVDTHPLFYFLLKASEEKREVLF